MSRDYKDLDDPNLAVYNFRGYTIVYLDKKRKQVEFGRDAAMCHLCTEDLEMIPKFILECKDFIEGKINNVENVEVN